MSTQGEERRPSVDSPPAAQFDQHVVEALTGTTPGDFDLVKLNWRHPMLFFEIMIKNTLCYRKKTCLGKTYLVKIVQDLCFSKL